MAQVVIGTGGDFSTISAWLASLPSTITGVETALLKGEDFDERVDLTSYITDRASGKYFVIGRHPSAPHHKGLSKQLTGFASPAFGDFSEATSNSLLSSGQDIDVTDVEITMGVAASNGQCISITNTLTAGYTVTIARCVIVPSNSVVGGLITEGLRQNNSSVVLKFYRNAVIGWGGNGLRIQASSASSKIYNNTFTNCGQAGLLTGDRHNVRVTSTAALQLYQNISFSPFSTGTCYNLHANNVTSKNASSDTTGGTGAYTSLTPSDHLTNSTASPATCNCRIKKTSSLRKVATNLGTPYNRSIRNSTIRSKWDVGADQYPTFGGGSLFSGDIVR